jgi:hypothetical protein
MAQLGNFDYTKVEKSNVIPDGEYAAKVVESDITATKDGTGKILLLVFEVIEGPQKGRRHWERLNIVNKSPEAQRLAHQSLARICEAAGAPVPLTDSEQLHHKPLMLKLGHLEDDYGVKNKIKKVSPYRASGGRPVDARPPANGGGSGMPWD